eukprot:scaffold2723_cov108-Isochrysis_galbana.AAC.10
MGAGKRFAPSASASLVTRRKSCSTSVAAGLPAARAASASAPPLHTTSWVNESSSSTRSGVTEAGSSGSGRPLPSPGW